MAFRAITADLQQALPNLGVNVQTGSTADPVAALAAVTTAVATAKGAHLTATEAAVAVLEADAASPTQAHVAALRVVWDVTSADITAVSTTAATAALGADVALVYDPAVVLTMTRLRQACDALLRAAAGSGTLTA